MSILKKVIRAVKKIFNATVKPRRAPKKRPSKRKTVKVVRRRPVSKPKVKVVKASVSKKAAPVAKKTAKKALPPKPAGVLVGEVTHYFDRIKVCVIRIDRDHIKRGDRLVIEGPKGSVLQPVSSMQIENEDVVSAKKGQLIGLKVAKEVSVKDGVYKI
jgi:hypothetical protein